MIRITLGLLAALALSAGAATAQAPAGADQQQPAPGQRGPGRRIAILMQGITLTAEQQAQIDSIQVRYRSLMPAMTPGTPPDSASMAERRALMARQDAEIRAVLTAEQQVVFDRNLEQARQNMGRGRP